MMAPPYIMVGPALYDGPIFVTTTFYMVGTWNFDTENDYATVCLVLQYVYFYYWKYGSSCHALIEIF